MRRTTAACRLCRHAAARFSIAAVVLGLQVLCECVLVDKTAALADGPKANWLDSPASEGGVIPATLSPVGGTKLPVDICHELTASSACLANATNLGQVFTGIVLLINLS